jgi:hypothetical protein
MKKVKNLLIILLLFSPIASFAQLDCSSFLSTLKPESPFNLNSLSKSAACVSGHTYELVVPVQKDYEYRIVFYSSPVFNDDVDFQIVDLNTNKTIINTPGKLADGQYPSKNGQTALQSFFDDKTSKEMHPYFDIIPNASTNLKIVINVKEKADLIKGCVTVVLLDRPFDAGNFQ